MFTDTVGYTAATQIDEARTLESLRQQSDLVRPLLVAHRGREIKSTGDGFLVEFDSALKATQCAVDIQRRIYERNAEGAFAPIQIRIGIHLGDVVQSGTDILGDAVNIAARIEPVAEPGGICVSGAVREQVWNKVADKLEKLPPAALKGLQFPMEIYRVVLPWTLQEPSSGSSRTTGLAVLPFANISPDPKDEYFADGLTEELITVLSQIRDLRVIARTSVMQYKSASKPVSRIGAELDVSTVLEGSVRKSGNRLRVTAQLIDVGSQGHVWAATYDRELDDVFAVQADIAKQVGEALKIGLRAAAEARLASRAAVRPDSYLAYLKGRTLMHDSSQTSIIGARKQFELAISLDPKNAPAHAGLADAIRFRGPGEEATLGAAWDQEGRRLVSRAVELDPTLPEAHASLGLIHWDDWEWAAAETEFKRALSLNPSYSFAHHWFGMVLQDLGRADEALAEFTLAEGADPLWPTNLAALANVLAWVGRPDEALIRIQKLAELAPDSIPYHGSLSFYHSSQSDLTSCVRDLQRISELMPDPGQKQLQRALACALAGDKEQARTLMQRVEEAPETPSYSPIAWVYANMGDLDGCFRWLETALKRRIWMLPIGWFRLYPGVALLRADARFGDLLKKMNLA